MMESAIALETRGAAEAGAGPRLIVVDAPAKTSGVASGALGASWGVAFQEILLWPLALAAAFIWMLEVEPPGRDAAASVGRAFTAKALEVAQPDRADGLGRGSAFEAGGAFAR